MENGLSASFEGGFSQAGNNTSSSTSKIEFIPPSERIKRFGIECIGPAGDGIMFRAGEWKPGGEYIHKLIVRNVSTTVKKLKYKLPVTRYFSMAYPEVIVLSPGMFTEIDVVFRPVEYAPYDDSIYMKMQEGPGSRGFHVPVGATIEKLILSVPFGLDLGWCPAFQTTSTSFKLVNDGEIDAPFRWEDCPPFVLEPSRGVIPFGKSLDITVSIYPRDASVFVAQATCIVGEGADALIPEPVISTRLSAICKHAFIVLSENEINFGEVLSGTSADSTVREVELRNNSVVPAEFELIRHEGDKDEVFEITPRRGVIEAMSEMVVKVKYHALAMGVYSLDRYTFKTPGNCLTTLTCKGMSMPPKITLFKEMKGIASAGGGSVSGFPEGSPANSINFRDVEIGKVETRIVFLKNDSNIASSFSVVADYAGVFQIQPQQGLLPALTQYCPVKLVFSPLKPINYYRRIFVLISDGQPLFIDVMGTGFIRAKGEIKEQRPAPLRHAHVQSYCNRLMDGYAGLNPDQLDEINKEGLGKKEYFAQVGLDGTLAMSVASLKFPLTRTGETSRNVVAPAHEFFISESDTGCRVVVVNKSTLDFGFTPYMSTSEPHSVTITNNTNGKVCVMWSVPRVHGDDRIEPDTSSMSTSMVTSKMGQSMAEDPLAPVFLVDPEAVDINPGKSHTFRIFFRPKQSNRNYVSELEAYVYFKNQRTFRLVDDATLTPPWCLPITAVGHTFSSGQLLAKGRLTGGSIRGGKLVFPSCYIHDALYETVILKNASNMPCTYRLELGWEAGLTMTAGARGNGGAHGGEDVFSVKPACGEIDAGGFVLVCVRFAPTEARKKYIQLVRCIINGDDGGKLLLEGTGDVPVLSCPDLRQQPTIEDDFLGPVGFSKKRQIPSGFQGSVYLQPTCVGLSSTQLFSLKNSSRLPLRYVITLPPEAQGILTITPLKGLLKGNDETKVTILFAPMVAQRHEFKIKIKSYPVGGRAPRVLDARQVGQVEAPEELQSLRVSIIAPSSIGAIAFDPPRTTAQVRLVNTFETKDIFIENVSDSDLTYSLHYCTEFIADTGSLSKPRTVTSLRRLFTSRAAVTHHSSDLDDSLFCEYPEGLLPARSRKRIPFTFYPTNAGLYEFLIHAKLTAIDPNTGAVVEMSNEEAALLRTSQENREANIASDFGNDTNEFSSSYYSGAMPAPLMANITARAAFPTMVVEDIRAAEDTLVSNIELLWRRFSLHDLNHDLSIPPTVDELKLYSASSPDMNRLKRYAFEFTPAVVGSPLQTLHMQIRNNGFLTTSFRAHLPNEKELDLEQWCDEDEPSEELNAIICIIEELKVFSFEPKSAVLAPGESCTITVSYSHAHLKYGGLHKIPLLVKVDQGKMFYIDLIGKTIPLPQADILRIVDSQQTISNGSLVPAGSTSSSALPGAAVNAIVPPSLVLWVPDASTGVARLSQVPIGLNHCEAPLQRIEVVNLSSVDSVYEIDMENIFMLNQSQCDQPIFRIANPKGSVFARSSTFIDVYFYPLEVKTYTVSVSITYTPLSAGVGAIESLADGLASRSQFTKGGTSRNVSPTGRSRLGSSATDISVGSNPKRKMKTGAAGLRNATAAPKAQQLSPPVPLLVTIAGTGYDPRAPRPPPIGYDYDGGVPPSIPLLKLPGQPVSISSDLVQFDVVPQACIARRLIIVKNILESSSIDFSLDLAASWLIQSQLLSVTPTAGRLDVGEHAVFEFIVSGNAPPTIFSDTVKLVVREVIKDTGGRKTAGANAKLLEKLRTKKAPVDHDSVVIRSTSTVTAHILSSTNVPAGRVPGLPSTVTKKGLVEPSKSEQSQVQNPDMQEYSLQQAAGSSPGRGRSESPTRFTETNTPASPTSGMRSFSRAGGLEASMATTDVSRPGTSSSSRFSGTSNGRNGQERPALLGPPKAFIIRIKGEIFTADTVNTLLENGPLKGLRKDFVMPAHPQFIPASTVLIPTPRKSTDGEDMGVSIEGGNMLQLPSLAETESSMDSRSVSPAALAEELKASMLEETSKKGRSLSTMSAKQLHAPPSASPDPGAMKRSMSLLDPTSKGGPGAAAVSSKSFFNGSGSGGSVSLPNSPATKSRKAIVPGQARDASRDSEIRRTVEDVLFDTFRSLLTSVPVEEYAACVLKDALQASPSLGGLKLDADAEPDAQLTAPVVGKPVYGVFFQEIVKTRPLHERLIREVKHLGYVGLEDTLELAESDTQYHIAVGDGTNRTHEVVEGIPARWTKGDDSALLADSSHFTLRKCDVVNALKAIGLPLKGHAMKGILAQISKSFGGRKGRVGDLTPVCIVKLVVALPMEVSEKLSKRVDDCYWKRMLHERLTRKTVLADGSTFDNSSSDELEGEIGVDRQDSLASSSVMERQVSFGSSTGGDNSNTSGLSGGLSMGQSGDGETVDGEVRRLLSGDSLDGSVVLGSGKPAVALSATDALINQFLDTIDVDVIQAAMDGTLPPPPVEVDQEQLAQEAKKASANAATAIQRLARGADARSIADKRYQSKLDEQTKNTICQDVFVDTAAAVLHSTIFNLLQEASFGEFSITADPLKYVMKK